MHGMSDHKRQRDQSDGNLDQLCAPCSLLNNLTRAAGSTGIYADGIRQKPFAYEDDLGRGEGMPTRPGSRTVILAI
jgi:hypothetical protein